MINKNHSLKKTFRFQHGSSCLARIKFIKKRFFAATGAITINLDFPYVDVKYNYLPVLNDFKLYYPKIKKGIINNGYDFSAEYYNVAK